MPLIQNTVFETSHPLINDDDSSSTSLSPLQEALKAADLAHEDVLGPDPFHERHSPAKAHLNYVSFHPNKEPIETAPNGLPKLFNFIWMGSSLKREDFRTNLADWAAAYVEKGFIPVLWTDQTMVDAETQRWCDAHHIRLAYIFDVFDQEHPLDLEPHFLHYTNSFFPNFGAASDILRYEILHRFGGVYLDCDVTFEALYSANSYNPSFDEVDLSEEFATTFGSSSSFNGNDIFLAKPQSQFFKATIEEVKKEHESGSYHRQFQDNLDVRPDWVLNTIHRTGPDCVRHAMDRTCQNSRAKLSNRSTDSAMSWVTRKTVPLEQLSKEDILKKISTSILREIIDRGILDLSQFSSYICSEDQVEMTCLLLETYPNLKEKIKVFYAADPEIYKAIDVLLTGSRDTYAELIQACREGNVEMVCFFIEKKQALSFYEPSDDFYQIHKFHCPLKIAFLSGHLDIAAILYEQMKAVDLDENLSETLTAMLVFNTQYTTTQKPLYLESVNFCLEHGVDPHPNNSDFRWTHSINNWPLFESFKKHGAKDDYRLRAGQRVHVLKECATDANSEFLKQYSNSVFFPENFESLIEELDLIRISNVDFLQLISARCPHLHDRVTAAMVNLMHRSST